jgi:RND superfamily putative drug exporter
VSATSVATALSALGSRCAQRAHAVVAVWALVVVIAFLGAQRVSEVLAIGSGDVPGSVSLHVDDVLRAEFSSARSQLLVLTLKSSSLDRDPAALRSLVESVRDRWEKDAQVQEVLIEEDIPHRRLLPAAGTGHVIIVSLKARNIREAEAALPYIRDSAEPLLESARVLHPDLTWAVTGRAAVTHDLSHFGTEDTQRAELRALLPTLVILVIGFGSLAATAIPLVVGFASTIIALGVVWALAHVLPIADVVLSISSMIGLALGIDYSLFLIHRYREELRAGHRDTAIERSMETIGPVILYSGLTVLVGMAGLITAPLAEIRSIGIGGCLVVAATILLALTLLPAILALVGSDRLEWPRVLSSRLQDHGEERWNRWALWVTGRPAKAAVVGTVLLLALVAPGVQSRFGFPEAQFLPQELEYVRGLNMLDEMGLRGLVLPVPILVSDTTGQRVLTDDRVPKLMDLAVRLRQERCVSVVIGPIDGFDSQYVSADGRRILLQLIPRGECTIEDVKVLGRSIPSRLQVAGLKAEVGGQPQFYDDVEAAIKASYSGSVGFVLVGTCVLLLAAFRAPLVTLKALVLNAASVLAGYGAVVFVFQLGYGSALLGVAAPTEVIPASVPLLIFCILFGLSMDYEVFLLGRAHARFLRTHDNTQSVREALAETGPVITSAALIMVAVFGAFALSRVVLVQMIGLGLAVAVIVDATIIRSLLGPALMRLAGRWNWWPGASR